MEKKSIKWNVSWDIGTQDEGRNFNIWSNGMATPIAITHGNLPLKFTPLT
jgi:hypothetical protein